MKITVDKYACLGCLNCRDILNIDDGHDEFPKMPQMAFDGWEIRRLPADAGVILRNAVIECPGQALSFEE